MWRLQFRLQSPSTMDAIAKLGGSPWQKTWKIKFPMTYQRSAEDPLDCIFGSPSLQIKNGGCIALGRLLSDHSGIWIDIPNELLFVYKPPPLTH